ncbi:MAG TPA: hypothetical protein VKZ79_04730 [Alphaproteobacteria bacterium]|nr:hypothetical protein [Alphaproteobacteria bacterium]
MIDRKALWISILLVFAMVAANIWRISLLPDWHHVPAMVMGELRIIPVFWTFTPPLLALFFMALILALNWKFGLERTSPEEAVRPWRRRQSLALLFTVGMLALAEAFSTARSLGSLQSVDGLTFSHVMSVVAGIFVMTFGNMLPKMPRLTERFCPLDPWQWNQHLRFQGRLVFVFGLVMAVGMPFLPIKMAGPVGLGLSLAAVATIFWHRAKVKRESSPQP